MAAIKPPIETTIRPSGLIIAVINGVTAIASLPKIETGATGPAIRALFAAMVAAVDTAEFRIELRTDIPEAKAAPAPAAPKAPTPTASMREPLAESRLFLSLIASSHLKSPPPQKLLISSCMPLEGNVSANVPPSLVTLFIALSKESAVF